MSEPVFFVVYRRNGTESSCLCHDQLPADFRGKNAQANGLIYALRLDKLDDAERWLNMSLSELYQTYCWLRDRGRLPKSNLYEPPKKGDGSRPYLTGEETTEQAEDARQYLRVKYGLQETA